MEVESKREKFEKGESKKEKLKKEKLEREKPENEELQMLRHALIQLLDFIRHTEWEDDHIFIALWII